MSAAIERSREALPWKGAGSQTSDSEDGEVDDMVLRTEKIESNAGRLPYEGRRSEEDPKQPHLFANGYRKRPRSPTVLGSPRDNYSSSRLPQCEPSRFVVNSTTSTNATAATQKDYPHRPSAPAHHRNDRNRDDNLVNHCTSSYNITKHTTANPQDNRYPGSARPDFDRAGNTTVASHEGKRLRHPPSIRDRNSELGTRVESNINGRVRRGTESFEFVDGHRGETAREMCNPRVDRRYDNSYNIERIQATTSSGRRPHYDDDYKLHSRERDVSKSPYNRSPANVRRSTHSSGNHDSVSPFAPRWSASEQLPQQQTSYERGNRRSGMEMNGALMPSSTRGVERVANGMSDVYTEKESQTRNMASGFSSRPPHASVAPSSLRRFPDDSRPRPRSPSPFSASLRGIDRRRSGPFEQTDRQRDEIGSRYRMTGEDSYDSRLRRSSPPRALLSRHDVGRSSIARDRETAFSRQEPETSSIQRYDRDVHRYESDYSRRPQSPSITPLSRNARYDSGGNDASPVRRVHHDNIRADMHKFSRESRYDSRRDSWDHHERSNLSRQWEHEPPSMTRNTAIGGHLQSNPRARSSSPPPPALSSNVHNERTAKPWNAESRFSERRQQYSRPDTARWRENYSMPIEKHAGLALDSSLMNTSELYKEDRDVVRSNFASENWRKHTGDEKKDDRYDSHVESHLPEENGMKIEPVSKNENCLGSRWCPPSPPRKPTPEVSSHLYQVSGSKVVETTLKTRKDDIIVHSQPHDVNVDQALRSQEYRGAATAMKSKIQDSAKDDAIVAKNITDSSLGAFRNSDNLGRPRNDLKLTRPPSLTIDTRLSSTLATQKSNTSEASTSPLPTGIQKSKQAYSQPAGSLANASKPLSTSKEPSPSNDKSSSLASKPKVVKKESSPKSSLGIPMKWLKPVSRPPKKKISPVNQRKISNIADIRSEVKDETVSEKSQLPMKKRVVGEGESPAVPNKGVKGLSPEVDLSGPPKKRAKKMQEARSTSPVTNMIQRTVTDSEGGSTMSIENRFTGSANMNLGRETRRDAMIPSTINGRNVVDVAGATPELTLDDSVTASIDAEETKKRTATSVPSIIDPTKNVGQQPSKALDDDMLMESPSHPESRGSAASSSEVSSSSDSDDDDSDTDDEEVMMWAAKMFGVAPSTTQNAEPNTASTESSGGSAVVGEIPATRPKLHIRLSHVKSSPKTDQIEAIACERESMGVEIQQQESVELVRKKLAKKAKKKKREKHPKDRNAGDENMVIDSAPRSDKKTSRKKEKKMKRKLKKMLREKKAQPEEEAVDEAAMEREMEENRRKREMAKPLTAAQIRAILGDDWDGGGGSGGDGWVRRSTRQPLRSFLNSKQMQGFLHKLKTNAPDMVVLKMKKYISDPNVPQVVIDGALEALELNTNCEALYIQVSRVVYVVVISCYRAAETHNGLLLMSFFRLPSFSRTSITG